MSFFSLDAKHASCMKTNQFTDAAIWSFFVLMLALNGIWLLIKLELPSNGPRAWLPAADVSSSCSQRASLIRPDASHIVLFVMLGTSVFFCSSFSRSHFSQSATLCHTFIEMHLGI
jgi:hypothetical protein